MKVICIDDTGKSQITKGKVYSVRSSVHPNFYMIINDKGVGWGYPKSHFKLLREENLNKLIDESSLYS